MRPFNIKTDCAYLTTLYEGRHCHIDIDCFACLSNKVIIMFFKINLYLVHLESIAIRKVFTRYSLKNAIYCQIYLTIPRNEQINLQISIMGF